MTIIPDIVTQHAEEAAFLWLVRDTAVGAPHYSLADLARLDERVEAHIDGLRIAGTAGWNIAREQLAWKEPGEVFAAAVLALESGDDTRRRDVLEPGTSSPDAARGLISALGWLPQELVTEPIAELLAVSAPELRRVGIAAAAARRLGAKRALERALADADCPLRARALRAVGELGLVGLLPQLGPSLADVDDGCRFSAAWSAVLLGDRQAVRTLEALAEQDGPHQLPAGTLTLRRLDLAAAKAWQEWLVTRPGSRRLAVIGAGVIGDPALIPWLIEQMAEAPLARVAGEAFSMITGADVSVRDLEGAPPEGFQAGPTEDPEDEDVSMDPDENLPWPDPQRVDMWWHARRARFESGRRYLIGKPICREWLQHVLREGLQRQRAAAAIELAMTHPGQPLFEVRAPGFRQQALLNAAQRAR